MREKLGLGLIWNMVKYYKTSQELRWDRIFRVGVDVTLTRGVGRRWWDGAWRWGEGA